MNSPPQSSAYSGCQKIVPLVRERNIAIAALREPTVEARAAGIDPRRKFKFYNQINPHTPKATFYEKGHPPDVIVVGL